MITTPPAATPPTFDPSLVRDLMAEMLQSDCTIPQLAERFKLSFTELLAIVQSPEAQAQLDALEQLTQLRAQLRAATRREVSLARLAKIAEFSSNDLEARRAASTVLKEVRNTRAPVHLATTPKCPLPVAPTCPQVGARRLPNFSSTDSFQEGTPTSQRRPAITPKPGLKRSSPSSSLAPFANVQTPSFTGP
jgi:hypothetical protein